DLATGQRRLEAGGDPGVTADLLRQGDLLGDHATGLGEARRARGEVAEVGTAAAVVDAALAHGSLEPGVPGLQRRLILGYQQGADAELDRVLAIATDGRTVPDPRGHLVGAGGVLQPADRQGHHAVETPGVLVVVVHPRCEVVDRRGVRLIPHRL